MNASPFSTRKFIFLFAFAWLVLITDHAVLLYKLDFPLRLAIYDSLISNFLLLSASLLLMNTIRYYVPSLSEYLNVAVMCVVIAVLWVLLNRFMLQNFLGDYEGYDQFLSKSGIVRGSIGFLIIALCTMVTIFWINSKEQQVNETRKADAEKLAREAELFKLRQQLQPHFLFNSLNSINALIGIEPAEARKMVQQLSDFLRGTLKKEETQWVNLQEELQYLQLYLDIEKVRFGNRLTTKVKCSEESSTKQVPALLLQPIVENAIKFGLYDTIGDTVIEIDADVIDNELRVRVCNPYDPETSSPKAGTGFGLKSVQRRLYLLFARSDLLITEAADKKFTITLRIPQQLQAKAIQ